MKDQLVRYLCIGLAGFAGALMRVFVGMLFTRVRFPLGILIINVTGSFFLGWFYTYTEGRISATTRMAIGAGFVGAYTTFSTYMFDTNRLAEDGAYLEAATNLVGSLVLGLIAVKLGVVLARWSIAS